jgi:hypothetical protein
VSGSNVLTGFAKRDKEGYLPNLPYFVVAHTGTPIMAWGSTAVAKTSMTEAYAKKCGKKFHAFLPSHHLPEELSGTPVVFREEMNVKMLALDWVNDLKLPDMWLMLDEYNTGSAMMRALMLSATMEKRIGTLKFHPSVIITAAANPPELAPNAATLEASVANRFVHWQWKTPVASFLQGIESDEFPVPDYPIPVNWQLAEATWGKKIRMFLESKPEFIEAKTIEPDQLAFPSLRTWMHVRRGCAALESVDAPGKAFTDYVTACVGKTAAAMFVEFATSLDLFNAAAVMDGTEQVDFKAPLDRLLQLPPALIFHAQRLLNEGKLTDEMIDRAFIVLLELGEKGSPEAVKKPIATIATIRQGYRPPQQYRARFGHLLAQIMPKSK